MDFELDHHKIFSRLSDDEKQLLLNYTHKVEFKKNAFIEHEGQLPSYFFIILKGSVHVSKKDKEGVDHVIDTIHAGEVVGETSLVEDDKPRPVSYWAAEPVTVIAFHVASIKQNLILHDKLIVALSRSLAARLRKFKNLTFDTMQHRLREFRKRVALGAFLVGVIYTIDIYILSLVFIDVLEKKFRTTTFISIGILIIIVTIAIIYIKKFNYPLRWFGLTTKNWRKDTLVAILFSFTIMGLYTLGKWVAISTVFKGVPLFDFAAVFRSPNEFKWSGYFISMAGYILFVPFQEFIVRGTLQGTFYRFLAGTESQRTWTAIIVSNLLFAVAHVHKGPVMPFLAFSQGLLWGYLYSKQSSLIGVTISHWLIGVWVIFICGIEGLF